MVGTNRREAPVLALMTIAQIRGSETGQINAGDVRERAEQVDKTS